MDFCGGDEYSRSTVKLKLQMFGQQSGFFDQFQAAISGDSMRQVHHEIAVTQVEKAVNRTAQFPLRNTPQLSAMEHLVAADHDQRLIPPTEIFVEIAHSELQMATGGDRGRL